MNEKITVIIPAYQAKQYLTRCIGSIQAQTYRNTEILVIDGNSPDGTGDAARSMADKDARIRVIGEENQGVSHARNTGLTQASGALITFVDADDFLRPDMLRRLYDVLTQQRCDIAGCAFESTTQAPADYADSEGASQADTGEKPKFSRAGRGRRSDGGERVTHCCENPSIMSGREFIEKRLFDGDSRCWSKLYRRDYIGETRFDETLTIGEDMLFLLALMQKGGKIAAISDREYCYYRNPQGAMERTFRASYMDQITCWKKTQRMLAAPTEALRAKVQSGTLVSVLLVTQKLAFVKRGEEKRRYVRICLKELRKLDKKRHPQAYRMLRRGHRVRLAFFTRAPYLYLFFWKAFKKLPF